MAISSIGAKTGYTTSSTDTRTATDRKTADAAHNADSSATIADHVAALDEQQPIRSVSTTLGTVVDTYL
jgi:hypothetical protein